jgi:hypothetical protein
MTTTAKKAAPKPGTKDYRPAVGICRHRDADRLYDCATKIERPGWTWCDAHVKAHRAARKPAAAKAPKSKAVGKVVPISSRKPAPRPAKTPVARVPASVAALVVPTVEKVEE